MIDITANVYAQGIGDATDIDVAVELADNPTRLTAIIMLDESQRFAFQVDGGAALTFAAKLETLAREFRAAAERISLIPCRYCEKPMVLKSQGDLRWWAHVESGDPFCGGNHLSCEPPLSHPDHGKAGGRIVKPPRPA